jgi:hypothetical protein
MEHAGGGGGGGGGDSDMDDTFEFQGFIKNKQYYETKFMLIYIQLKALLVTVTSQLCRQKKMLFLKTTHSFSFGFHQ